MLDNYKFIKTALKKGITREDLNNDTIKAVTSLKDLELICLCAKTLDPSDINNLQLLINSAYINANKYNLEWLDYFISIIEKKNTYIKSLFSTDIENLKAKKNSLETYLLHRESSVGL